MDERRAARIATVCALGVVAAFVAGKAARDAILLANFSIGSLPLFTGLAAALSLPVIVITGRLMTRLGPARLVPAMNIASGLLLVGEWLFLDAWPRLVAVVVFFHLQAAGATLVSGFWSMVNERFDIQTAKRHIGPIGMGATVGGIVGGVVAERTSVYLPPGAILLVIAGLQLAGAALLVGFGKGTPRVVARSGSAGPRSGAQRREESIDTPPATESVAGVARSPLLRLVCGVVVLTAVAAGILDYVFKADIVGDNNGDLLRPLAMFYIATSVITAVIQIVASGWVIGKLGVPRTVATLPVAITGFSLLALVSPAPIMAAIARAAELITRNSTYRAGYELLYAPLPEERKRPTKVVLDVGADKVGDILAAQAIGLCVWMAVDVRTALLVSAVAVAGLCVIVVMRLPGAYTHALEDILLTYGDEAAPEPRMSLHSVPTFPMRLPRKAGARPPIDVLAAIGDLRSNNFARIKRALTGTLHRDVAPHAIDLLGRDDVAPLAAAALKAAAPTCTGLLVDALLDPQRDPKVRRRLPAILTAGDPQLAGWGLWRGLADPSFDIRYHCGAALPQVGFTLPADEVFAAVKRELDALPAEVVLDAFARLAEPDNGHPEGKLAHVFRLLGLALPSEPLRIALQAFHTGDVALRSMALEYLESVLPVDVRAQLWPLIDPDGHHAQPATPRAHTHEELAEFVERLRAKLAV